MKRRALKLVKKKSCKCLVVTFGTKWFAGYRGRASIQDELQKIVKFYPEEIGSSIKGLIDSSIKGLIDSRMKMKARVLWNLSWICFVGGIIAFVVGAFIWRFSMRRRRPTQR